MWDVFRIPRQIFNRRGVGFYLEPGSLTNAGGFTIHIALTEVFLLKPTVLERRQVVLPANDSSSFQDLLNRELEDLEKKWGVVHEIAAVIDDRATHYAIRFVDILPRSPADGLAGGLPKIVTDSTPRGVDVSGLAVDWQSINLGGQDAVRIVYARKGLIDQCFSAMTAVGRSLNLYEPGSVSALRNSFYHSSAQQDLLISVRIHVGDPAGMAWLLRGSEMIAWTRFERSHPDPLRAIQASLEQMRLQAIRLLPSLEVRKVQILGLAPNNPLREALSLALDTDVEWIESEPFSPSCCATGAALAVLDRDQNQLDLGRDLRKDTPLHRLVPLGDFVSPLLGLAFIALVFWFKIDSLNVTLQALQSQVRSYEEFAQMDDAALQRQLTSLSAVANQLGVYSNRQVFTSAALIELTGLVSENAQVTSFTQAPSADIAKVPSLTIGLNAEEDMGDFVDVLKAEPTFSTVFPEIKMESVDVKVVEGRFQGIYQIVCRGRAPASAAASPGQAATPDRR